MHSVTQIFNRRTGIACVSALCISLPATADDLDVYTAQLAGQIKPNVLLILDYSGSMRSDVNGDQTDVDDDKKISILKDAVNDLMIDHENRINLGLGSLYASWPSGVRWPISDLTADPSTVDPDIPSNTVTMREVINEQLDQFSARGSTNTVGGLAEAALYYRGGLVTHNDADIGDGWSHQPDSWNNAILGYDGGNKRSALPASYTPRDAYQFNDGTGMLTSTCRDYSYYDPDGLNSCEGQTGLTCELVEPYSYTADHDEDPATPVITINEPGYNLCEFASDHSWNQPNYNSPISRVCQKNYTILISDGYPTSRSDGPTLESVLGAPSSTCEDLSSRIFGDPEKTSGNCGPEIVRRMATEDQIPAIADSKVKTYTIGFSIGGSGAAYLDELAKAGQGKFFQADDKDELTDALGLLLDDILKSSENFAELSIDLDKASFSHDNRAYFSLFNPSTKRSWDGNVKGYFLTQNGLVDVKNDPAIISDMDGTRFDTNAQSFWSSIKDGNEVLDGGASEQIVAGGRNLYTYTGNAADPFNVDLTANEHALDKSNSEITDAMLNYPGNRNALLDWLQTAPMGSPLHSKAITANYANKRVVYAITNQGFLHAIDADKPTDPASNDTTGGEELFAFMPQALLSNLKDIQQNDYATANNGHIYGLDGQLTPIHLGDDGDGIVDSSKGEKLILVFGMRRGGNNYYAVDVTDYDSPKLLWRIRGGVAPFENLAQSWSRMSLVTVKTNIGSKQVLVFGGGYQANVVDNTDGDIDANGNAIYMINLDRSLVWSTSGGEMNRSIPSDITVVDTDSDGMADRMYVGDVGSNVWRVKFDNVDNSGDFEVTKFADLYNTRNQAFFYPPSVALNRSATGDFLSISVASGNRTDPLRADTKNAIYMIRDTEIINDDTSGPNSPITITNLFKATDNSVASADNDVATAARNDLAAKHGWYVELNNGEKALSTLLSFEGNLLATTYEPSTADGASVCEFEATGKLYIMDLRDGRPVKYLNDGSTITEGLAASDRVTLLNGTGIPSSPVLVFAKGTSQVDIIVDKEKISSISQTLSRVFWYAK